LGPPPGMGLARHLRGNSRPDPAPPARGLGGPPRLHKGRGTRAVKGWGQADLGGKTRPAGGRSGSRAVFAGHEGSIKGQGWARQRGGVRPSTGPHGRPGATGRACRFNAPMSGQGADDVSTISAVPHRAGRENRLGRADSTRPPSPPGRGRRAAAGFWPRSIQNPALKTVENLIGVPNN